MGEGRAVDRGRARVETAAGADLAWILLLPAVAVAAAAIAVLAPVGGRLLLPDPGYHYWTGPGLRKPAVDVGYVLFAFFAMAYAGAIVRSPALRMRPRVRQTLVATAQVATLTFVVVCFVAQRRPIFEGVVASYFSVRTLVVAAVATVAVAAASWWRARAVAGTSAAIRLAAWSGTRAARACLGVAVLATVVFVLPAVHPDSATPSGESLGVLFYDEATAVLNGRSTFVDMVAYGNVWPYLTQLPLRVFGDGYLTFTVTMAAITALALLAVYGVLRRVVQRPLLALALYLPVLASSFFVENRIGSDRYDPGTYFGMFPLRYAGPYLLAWLTVWQSGRSASERWSRRVLFAVAGLVALNNVDFGVAALAATVVARLVLRWPVSRRAAAGLALDVAIGVGAALATIAAVTLVREGTLPHLGLLVRYGRIFVNGGVANLPLPRLGMHLAISATFVAAGAVAAVRVRRTGGGDPLAAMLAWCAVFGIGASVYYYAYRSHPSVLVNLFSIWSLTLALLLVAALRASVRSRRPLSVPALAVAFGFALLACSLAQVPSPVEQLRRIAAPAAAGVTADGFHESAAARLVAAGTKRGERVAVISAMGHRIAREAGVTNVAPYTGFEQMPAVEQVDETVAILRREGGNKVYVAQREPPGFALEMTRLGFRLTGRWTVESLREPTVSEYRSG